MLDLGHTIVAKSDQLNSDDLMIGPITIRITDIKVVSGEQPVIIHYDGDNGKPYKPCKSMLRVLVHAWGRDASQYKGRSLRLYRDPNAMYGGMKVGGIRISNMSHIRSVLQIPLTERRGVKKMFQVDPLPDEQPSPRANGNAAPSLSPEVIDELRQQGEDKAAGGLDDLKEWWDGLTPAEQKAMKPHMQGIKDLAAVYAGRNGETGNDEGQPE